MLVIPTIYLTATDALVTEGYANRTFVYSAMEELLGANSLPYGCKTVYYAEQTLENLTMRTARIYTAAFIAIPVVIAAVGCAVVIRRKNR
jgi:hypothetical protein